MNNHIPNNNPLIHFLNHENGGTRSLSIPRILVASSFPPHECGIANYTQDLVSAMDAKFKTSFAMSICALEKGHSNLAYSEQVTMILDTSKAESFTDSAKAINSDKQIKLVLIQHEFGIFREQEHALISFIQTITVPVMIAFHTVLPNPDDRLKLTVRAISSACDAVIVMTKQSLGILENQYKVAPEKLTVIAHGTHLVSYEGRAGLKQNYGLRGRKVLSTFGLLRSGKGIETTLDALPSIVDLYPEVLFLLLGKTHPAVLKAEGQKYRNFLHEKVEQLGLRNHVAFIDGYLSLPILLDYLQLTDIYLLTSNETNQTVSGTFVYAMSCACPIISTPIPQAREELSGHIGVIVDYGDSEQLSKEAIRLLQNDSLRMNMSLSVLQKIIFTSWENSAVAHARLFTSLASESVSLHYDIPEINLKHLRNLTNHFGIIQFAKLNHPDLNTGYTLDDNARALVTVCMHYALFRDDKLFIAIRKYLRFVALCQQSNGSFVNYIDRYYKSTEQNQKVNLDVANGNAVWALGYLISLKSLLPESIIKEAESILDRSLIRIGNVSSVRAMAFSIKGLFYSLGAGESGRKSRLIETFANRMVQMYQQEKSDEWSWFEGYLNYANSILPEAMLYAWLDTGDPIFREIAVESMDFLLSKIFRKDRIELISSKYWLTRDELLISNPHVRHSFGASKMGGQQPMDVAYTLMTLAEFYNLTKENSYLKKMGIAFSWFLGNNHLGQTIYNPSSGGCYDSLEEDQVNLNQGAESTLCYLMARLTIEMQKWLNASAVALGDGHQRSSFRHDKVCEMITSTSTMN
jgi:glycosyltransferase involved in cell wall biosynthesis